MKSVFFVFPKENEVYSFYFPRKMKSVFFVFPKENEMYSLYFPRKMNVIIVYERLHFGFIKIDNYLLGIYLRHLHL